MEILLLVSLNTEFFNMLYCRIVQDVGILWDNTFLSVVTWCRKTQTTCRIIKVPLYLYYSEYHTQKCTCFEFDKRKIAVFTYKKSYQVSYGSAHFEIHVANAIGNKHIFEIELKRCCNKHRHFVFAKTYTDFPSL